MALRRSARTCLTFHSHISSAYALKAADFQWHTPTRISQDELPLHPRFSSAQDLPAAPASLFWLLNPSSTHRHQKQANHITKWTGVGLPHHLHSCRRLSGQPLPVEDSNHTKEAESNEKEVPASGKIEGPSPEDVDREMDNYDKLLEKQQKLSYPPTYQPWGSRIAPAAKATFSFIVGIPAWLASALVAPFKKGWWSHQWKHIKEGSKHYWVSSNQADSMLYEFAQENKGMTHIVVEVGCFHNHQPLHDVHA